MTRPGEYLEMAATLLRGARLRKYDAGEKLSIGVVLARTARSRGDAPALTDDSETIGWAEFNARANRVAHQLRERHGIGAGDAVAMMIENRIAFLTTLFGICKLGAVAGLINTNQRDDVLVHSIGAIDAKAFVVGAELVDAVAPIRDRLDLEAGRDFAFVADPLRPDDAPPAWATVLDDRDASVDSSDPPEALAVTIDDPCFYIFTSGTTGMPKAAVVSNERVVRGMQGFGSVCLNSGPDDRLYNCLPLYHSTGLIVGFGSILWGGGSMFMRRRFSASSFLEETREQQTNVFVYIGEICRYLMHTPAAANDADNPVQKIIGNGLRPDIWLDFKARFGIPRVYEIYGASEGNSGFINAFNKDCTIGFGVSTHMLARFDVDANEIERRPDGLCDEVTPGEAGLLLIEIGKDSRFDGYTDEAATEQKVVRDVKRKGDAWFNTGDLLRQIDVGFAFGQKHYQFVDRTGDTFRWKGENCSTNEVGEILNAFPQVHTANVYGVEIPGTDGRAGMAAVAFDPAQVSGPEDVDWGGLADHVCARLPSYARPVFIRVERDPETTTTFKLMKKELKEAAFHPDRTDGEAIYVMKPGSDRYVRMDDDFYAQIMDGTAGY
ncbi:MAG TPA: long-chain-acyl-CoA synthetase [Pseudomonadales bacterium]|nr:long-chain-acyl-CoA synthetase [Pseudomonadales bacterium]